VRRDTQARTTQFCDLAKFFNDSREHAI
jgi:hypothetical protein